MPARRRPDPARRRLDGRRRRGVRPGRRGDGERPRDAERRRCRGAGRLLLDRLRLRRSEGASRTSSRTALARSASTGGRSSPASARYGTAGSSAPPGCSARPATTSCARCCGSRSEHDEVRGGRRPARLADLRGHLAPAIAWVLDLPHGVYHVAADGDCTWADFAEAIFEEAGLASRVRRITTAELARRLRGRRTRCCVSEHPEAPRLPHWREGLRACLANLSRRRAWRGRPDLVRLRDPPHEAAAGSRPRRRARGGQDDRGERPRDASSPRAHQPVRSAPCACSSPAAPASSARTSSKRLAAAGEDVAVLDKLTYSGNRANLDGVEHRASSTATSAIPTRSRRAAAGCDAIVNFAAETHVDRSILGAAEFIDTDVLGTLRAARASPATAGIRLRPGLDRRGLRRRPERASSSREERPAAAVQPVLRRRRPAETSRCSPPFAPSGSTRAITRGANTYGPNQYPEKLIPLFVTNALDGEPLPVYGDGRQRREWLHVRDHCAAVELVLREGRGRARPTTSAARSTRTSRSRSGSWS